ncbi:MAG: hypothetical protein AAGJ79_12830 [Verrucomicrobiota bacterium]
MVAALESFRERWMRDEVPLRSVLVIFAIFYGLLILIFSPDQLKNDEFRYFQGAHNLSQGFYVTEENPDFTNGPGYPLLLVPMISLLGFEFDEVYLDPEDLMYYVPGPDGKPIENLKVRLLPLRLHNALYLVAGLFMTFKAARLFLTARTSILIVLVIGLNPFQLRWVPFMMTESLTPLVSASFVWAYVKLLREDRFSWKYALLAGALFGYLALTRTIFGYVATAGIFLIPVFALIIGKRELVVRSVTPMILALGFCLPYLAYTYKHTGRVFCWATNGGELLYWITSPHDNEFGSWQQERWIREDEELSKHHLEFVQHVNSLPVLERTAAWEEGIRRNLETEGVEKALVRNYVANFCRSFFDMPRTKMYQSFSKLIWAVSGACFFFPGLVAGLIFLFRWRACTREIKLLMFIVSIYAGGAFLLPSLPRYWIPMLPAILIWMGYVFTRLLSIDVRLRPAEELEDSSPSSPQA